MSAAQLGDGTLVFVPGILGSELRRKGGGGNGYQRSNIVWGGDFAHILKTLSRHPDLLSMQDLEVGDVIREIRYPLSGALKIYGPLLDFCCSPGELNLQLGTNFRPFPYDWRQDLRTVAAELGTFVQSLPPPVYVVAHSMGGLITRLMLNTDTVTRSIVKGVFQIACPVAGSLKAYLTLRKQPDFGAIGEALLHLMTDRWTSVELMNSIGNMESIYQMLPPQDRKILVCVDGAMTSAVDLKIWEKRNHSFILGAIDVHRILLNPPPVKLTCLYSTVIKTDAVATLTSTYRLDNVCAQADGDGTVTIDSAIAASVTRIPYSGKDAEHTKLCTHRDVHAQLKSFLN